MVGAQASLESRIVRSFDRFNGQSLSPSLKSLRRRLIGELLGETEEVTATLDPAFEVVMHVGETTVTLPGSAIAEGVRDQVAEGVLMWTELDDVVAEGDAVAASGSMLRLGLNDASLSSTPVGLFLRFSGDRMASEVVFMGPTETSDVSAEEMPSVNALRAQLDS